MIVIDAQLKKYALVLVAISCFTGSLQAESNTWELRLCVDASSEAVSASSQAGLDIAVARIMADELGAQLTLESTAITSSGLARTLMAGSCDVVLGVGDGVGGVLSTVPYARLPYMFVTLESSGLNISSLDDAELSDARIGVYTDSPIQLSLENRGLRDNLVSFPHLITETGYDPTSPILDGLINDEIDLAIVFGLDAAHYAETADVQLVREPVRPELDLGTSILQHYRTLTMGVRPQDEALRNTLNNAIARRWDDIQAAISVAGEPATQVSRPTGSVGEPEIVLIAPISNTTLSQQALLGRFAWEGMRLAEHERGRTSEQNGLPITVIASDAPTLEATVRAAERVTALGAQVVISGIIPSSSSTLSKIAAESNSYYLDISPVSNLTDSERAGGSYSLGLSPAEYFDALISSLPADRSLSVFLIRSDEPQGLSLADYFSQADRNLPWTTAGTHALPAGHLSASLLDDLRLSEPDVVILALPGDQTRLALGIMQSLNPAPTVGILPDAHLQTPEGVFTLSSTAGALELLPIPALWSPSIDGSALNRAYTERTGQAMSATAWAAYAGVQIGTALVQSLRQDGPLAPGPVFFDDTNIGKASETRFADNLLEQDVYLLQVNKGANWSQYGEDAAQYATVVETLHTSNLRGQ